MAKVTFWEKPGCGGNARQKALLAASGHEVDPRSLLAEPWTADRLLAFFGPLPVEAWFNRASPRVKAGEIVPETMTADTALAAMLADPLLIRRPLMEADGRRMIGFDAAAVEAWIGLAPPPTPVGEGCPKGEDHLPCPAPTTA
ncbi:MAG: ArsC/Spx/MgsR family protein [Siculibacillus sp.]